MKALILALLITTTLTISLSALAQALPTENEMDEFNPFAENAEEILKEMDRQYELETGKSAFEISIPNLIEVAGCVQKQCEIFIQVVKSQQKLYLFAHGTLQATWDVSTGLPGYETPLLNSHPNGRIYDAYTSKKFPGGDYKGLGNMPYAVFIVGGFTIHGTAEANWSKLGSKASHGCIRVHPDNGLYFNRLVRNAGVANTWVSVQE